VRTFEVGDYPNPGIYHLTIACSHCDNPACAAACPTGRTVKDEATGLVCHDDGIKCLGEMCLMCVKACPYGHPVFIPEREEVGKCSGCIELVRKGEEPACVASCMMRALKFGSIDELKARYGDDLVTELPCFPDGGTGPNFFIKPSRFAKFADFEEKEL
jgi:anaerobic dimethyl sulfoxide reductase subunit B (iron-sulfur subunit)